MKIFKAYKTERHEQCVSFGERLVAFTVESYDAGGKNPTTVSATRTLIRDKAGNPICLVVEYSGGYLVSDVDDADFPELLKTFGVTAPVVRRRLHVGD